MSSYDKVVKLACKPKAANPKAKYLDPIIAATWSDDGAVHDVCKALSPRFREPNAIVVFKALIVLHTMIRNGATDNVLSYLSSADILRLRNVAAGQWEGYDAPRNLKHYAFYLDSRIRAYRELKHDAVRVQSETNRDMRVSQSIEDTRALSGLGVGSAGGSGSLQRSKTLAGRKLRSMTVEKGLLRETKAVQQMIDSLVQCKFYLDDLEDELTVTALRMLVKDLLVLFQACNEGVINVLENYFEMSHIDAKEALGIYRHFCKETEQVMEYLGVARKLENLLNVPIPHLKHAPVSLVGALEEYLKDPNFEQNRLEYKANKAAADKAGTSPAPLKSAMKKGTNGSAPSTPSGAKTDQGAGPSGSTSPKTMVNQAMVDFLDSIEKDIAQQNGAGPSSQPQPSPSFNPFAQQQSIFVTNQPTGMFALQQQPFMQAQTTGFMQPQPTGFLQPQATAFQTSPFPLQQTNPFPQQQQPTPTNPFPQQQQPTPTNPFPQQQQQPNPTNPFPVGQQPVMAQQTGGQFLGLPQQNTATPFQQQRQSMFLQPQTTGLLQPQATGSNPFRQSMMFPQTTGTPSFGASGSFLQQQPQSAQGSSFVGSSIQRSTSPFPMPNRPQSTPITGQKQTQPLTAVATHTTGTKNPFGVPVQPAPPVPKLPTLQELATGNFNSGNFGGGSAANVGGNNPLNPMQTGANQPFGQNAPLRSQTVPPPRETATMATPTSGAGTGAGSVMASIASSFTKPGQTSTPTSSSSNPFPFLGQQNTASTTSFSNLSGGLSSQPTGTTAPTTAGSVSSLQPQMTGFGGIKPFKPTSSFGASLLESLPPISDSPTGAQSPGPSGLKSNPTGFLSSNATGLPSALSGNSPSNPFPSAGNNSTGGGLKPNVTGLPFGNLPPFNPTGLGTKLVGSPTGALNVQPTGLGALGSTNASTPTSGLSGGLRPQITGGANPFRASMISPSTSSMPSFNAGTHPFPPPNLPSSFNLNGNQTGFNTNANANSSQTPFGSQQNTSTVQNGSLI